MIVQDARLAKVLSVELPVNIQLITFFRNQLNKEALGKCSEHNLQAEVAAWSSELEMGLLRKIDKRVTQGTDTESIKVDQPHSLISEPLA